MSRTFKSDRELHELYDEFLNESGPVRVAGLEYDTASLLKNADETAYRCGFVDWLDASDYTDTPEDDSEFSGALEALNDAWQEFDDVCTRFESDSATAFGMDTACGFVCERTEVDLTGRHYVRIIEAICKELEAFSQADDRRNRVFGFGERDLQSCLALNVAAHRLLLLSGAMVEGVPQS